MALGEQPVQEAAARLQRGFPAPRLLIQRTSLTQLGLVCAGVPERGKATQRKLSTSTAHCSDW